LNQKLSGKPGAVHRDPEQAITFSKIAHGESIQTAKHIEDWLANSRNQPKTIDMKRSDVRRLAAKFEYTHQIDMRAVRQWVHDLAQGEKGLAAATLNRIISACRGYWDFLNRAGHLSRDDDPFKSAVPKTSNRSKSSYENDRLPFQKDDLRKLLQASDEKGDAALRSFIEIAMWTGCRIEEIGSLKLSDVSYDRIIVADSKSKAGNREVPIHSKLRPNIQRLIGNRSEGYLLSDLSFNKYSNRSNAVGKRFGRLKTSLGYSGRYVFHSIRKTVATELENSGVPENVAADILGHDKPTMTYGTYSGGTSFPIKQKALEELQFPQLGTLDLV